jgi:ABC-type multidrug transport system ATPase subunit
LGDPKLLIVDEPTAGLDPEERNRFHALLSEIGRDVVVILSTHIVDDVAKLCSSIAIMEQGEVVAHGTVDNLLDAFRGRIWAKLVEPGEVAAYRSKYHVISSRLSAYDAR